MQNITLIEENGNRNIISKSFSGSEEVQVEFEKYDSLEEKNRIRSEAKYIYKQLQDNSNNSCTRTIDSEISRINYYGVTYDSIETLSDGRTVNELDTLYEYEYAYNPYYYNRLVAELNKLAKKDDVYLSYSLQEDKLAESYMMHVESLTKEQFENVYDLSLDQYYEAISGKTNPGKTKKETRFRNKLAKLRKAYIEFYISDIDKGFDTSFIEMDGYCSYLMVAADFKDLPNKEEIANELGFVIDKDNHSLLLKSNRNHELLLK